MTKKSTKTLWIVGLIVVGLLLANEAGLFSVYFTNPIFITTNFTALVGTTTPINSMEAACRAPGSPNNQEQICYINSIIQNVYGYIILNAPVKTDKKVSTELVSMMQNLNKEVKYPAEYSRFNRAQKSAWTKAFGRGIFTNTLISTVKQNRYSYSQAKTIARELDKSLNNFCNGLNVALLSGKFNEFYGKNQENDDLDLWLQICAKKPAKVFVVTASGIKISMPDIDVYDYKRYNIICNASNMTTIIVYDQEGNVIVPTPCKEDEICRQPIQMCQIVPLPLTQKIYVGKLEFSKLRIEVKPLGNDFVIGVNNGVSMMNSLKSKTKFADYILQMPYNEGKVIGMKNTGFPVTESGFAIITTNSQVSKLICTKTDCYSTNIFG